MPAVKEVLTVSNRERNFKAEAGCLAVNDAAVPMSFIPEPVGRKTSRGVAAA